MSCDLVPRYTMASSAMITVPTTASRFALLQIDSDSDSDTSEPGKSNTKPGRDSSSGKPRQGKSGATTGSGGKGAQGCDKKKDKKKKRKEQQQSEANEVRLYWGKSARHAPYFFCSLIYYKAESRTVVSCSIFVSFHRNWKCSQSGAFMRENTQHPSLIYWRQKRKGSQNTYTTETHSESRDLCQGSSVLPPHPDGEPRHPKKSDDLFLVPLLISENMVQIPPWLFELCG